MDYNPEQPLAITGIDTSMFNIWSCIIAGEFTLGGEGTCVCVLVGGRVYLCIVFWEVCFEFVLS